MERIACRNLPQQAPFRTLQGPEGRTVFSVMMKSMFRHPFT